MRRLLSASAVSLLALAGAGAQSVQRSEPPNGLIVGQVVDADTGRPIAGAVVMLGVGPVSSEPTRVAATSEGRFVFRDLPAGTISLVATKTGYALAADRRRRLRARRRHARATAAGGRSPVRVPDNVLPLGDRVCPGYDRDRRIRRGTERDRLPAPAVAGGARVGFRHGARRADLDVVTR